MITGVDVIEDLTYFDDEMRTGRKTGKKNLHFSLNAHYLFDRTPIFSIHPMVYNLVILLLTDFPFRRELDLWKI